MDSCAEIAGILKKQKTVNYIALTDFTIGDCTFKNTLKPHIHLTSGNTDRSELLFTVPQRKHL